VPAPSARINMAFRCGSPRYRAAQNDAKRDNLPQRLCAVFQGVKPSDKQDHTLLAKRGVSGEQLLAEGVGVAFVGLGWARGGPAVFDGLG